MADDLPETIQMDRSAVEDLLGRMLASAEVGVHVSPEGTEDVVRVACKTLCALPYHYFKEAVDEDRVLERMKHHADKALEARGLNHKTSIVQYEGNPLRHLEEVPFDLDELFG